MFSIIIALLYMAIYATVAAPLIIFVLHSEMFSWAQH